MSYAWEPGRCVCGCPRGKHDHYRAGADCGHCGEAVCDHYVPLASRDSAILTVAQQLALCRSDVRMYRNAMALAMFALSSKPIFIPEQRKPMVTIGAILVDRRKARSQSQSRSRNRTTGGHQ